MKFIHTADWHLGHLKVSTEIIATRLRKFLFPKIPEADVLFIVGDIFDGVISMNSTDATAVLDLFSDLFMLCHKHDVVVRIVQGTFSHDRKQLKLLQTIYRKLKITLDMKIISKMNVEQHDLFTALYMPDNLPFPTKREVMKNVKKLLASIDAKEVDITCIHGEFDFASHHFVNKDTYTPKDFSFSKKVICGHIHTPFRRDHVVYSGSFDRLRHNEETKRGYWFYDGKWSFIENTDATRFITHEISKDMDLSECLKTLTSLITKRFTKDPGFLRIKTHNNDLVKSIQQFLTKNHPHITLTRTKAGDGPKSLTSMKIDTGEQLEVPDKKTLPKILMSVVDLELTDICKVLDMEVT